MSDYVMSPTFHAYYIFYKRARVGNTHTILFKKNGFLTMYYHTQKCKNELEFTITPFFFFLENMLNHPYSTQFFH